MAWANTETTRTSPARKQTFWRVAQVLSWSAGMFVWGALLLKPELGLHLLWNVLIPVVPALLVLAPGVWRNVCPLGSMSLAPQHFGLSQHKQVSPAWRGRLYLGALVLLLVVVPLRKVLLDANAPLLAAILGAVGLLAIGMGLVFTQKSGWCSSLCPVYPVELLYGSHPVVSVRNAHCPHCSQCVSPCSESTVGLTPRTAVDTALGRFVGVVLTGCFPGFVWGWYNVPAYGAWEGVKHLHLVYGIPCAAGMLTLGVYLVLRKAWTNQEHLFGRVFAAAAAATYYWYRLPAMFGIDDPNAAMIVDISEWLAPWSATGLRMFEVALIGWLMVVRAGKRRAWEIGPPVLETSDIHTTFAATKPPN